MRKYRENQLNWRPTYPKTGPANDKTYILDVICWTWTITSCRVTQPATSVQIALPDQLCWQTAQAHRGAVEQLDKCHPRWAAPHCVTASDASVCQCLLKLKAANANFKINSDTRRVLSGHWKQALKTQKASILCGCPTGAFVSRCHLSVRLSACLSRSGL